MVPFFSDKIDSFLKIEFSLEEKGFSFYIGLLETIEILYLILNLNNKRGIQN